MKSKIVARPYLWATPLALAALAVVGALALFGALNLPNPETADAQATAPGPVGNLTAKQIEYHLPTDPEGSWRGTPNTHWARIYLSWDPPTNTGGSAVTGYKLDTYDGGDATTISVSPTRKAHLSTFSGASNDITDTWWVARKSRHTTRGTSSDASPGRWWRFTVTPRNSAGLGTAQTVDIRLDSNLPDRPDPVREDKIRAAQTSYTPAAAGAEAQATIRIDWDPPTSDGGRPITGYNIYALRSNVGNTIGSILGGTVPARVDALTAKNIRGTSYTFTLTGSQADHRRWWRFEVAAVNSVHESQIYGDFASGDGLNDAWVDAQIDSSFRPTGVGVTGSSGFITAPTIAPVAPRLTARNTAISVAIAAPASNASSAEVGSPDYTGFDLEYRKGSSGSWTRFDGVITLNPRNLSGAALLSNLDNGSEYEVRIRVTRGDGYGPWSPVAKATPMATTPGPIRNLTAKQIGWIPAAESSSNINQAVIYVTWDPPTDNGGSPITGYDLDILRGGNGNAISSSLTSVFSRKFGGANGVWKNDREADMTDLTHTTGQNAGVTLGRDNQWLEYRVGAANAQGAGNIAKVQIQVDKDAARDLPATWFTGTIASDSTSSGAAPKLTVKLTNLDTPLSVGSRVVLFLEDDFDVPDVIPASSIYFVANSPASVATGNGAPVYATVPPEIDEDAYFDDDKDDTSILVRIPDMCAGDSTECEGPNGVAKGQDLTMVILGSSGIKNPSEAGTHTVAFDVLGFDDALPGRIARLMTNGMEQSAKTATGNRSILKRQGVYVSTEAKIALSSIDGTRGEMITINGSGFNNGVTAIAYVNQRKAARFAVAQWWETLNCEKMKAAMGPGAGNEFCFHYTLNETEMTYTVASKNKDASDKVFARHLCEVGIVDAGQDVGDATVGSDDRVAISFEVAVPTFKPGNDNLICVEDGEGRASAADIENFELTPSISVSPNEGQAGDEVTIFAQDFPTVGASFTELKVGGVVIKDGIRSTSISSDGSATVTFKLPPQKGVKRVDAKWGSTSEDAKVTILPAILNVSKDEVIPNERITLTGTGFATGAGSGIMAEKITIGDVPLHVYDDSVDSDDEVEVSSGGQFVVAVAIWPADDATSNPTLTPGKHTIRVEDKKGYEGEVEITILEPTVSSTPAVAGPRDVVTVSGENWPSDNPENSIDAITVNVTDGDRMRQYSVYADGSGRWFIEHLVDGNVPIPSTSRVEAKYEDLVKLADIAIPASVITVAPGEGQPGDEITLSVEKMPVHSRVSRIEIGGRDAMPAGTPGTNGDGAVTVEDIVIPGLDPGTYSVLLEVNNTVAIGELEILPEGPIGSGTPVSEALAPLADKLVAVFYFDGISKEWLFYDARPEFADFNTLTELVAGEAYWILISEDVADTALNGKSRSLTCSPAGNCWNLMVW